MSLPLHRFLNMIYKWLWDRQDPEKLEEFEYMLRRPLIGRLHDNAVTTGQTVQDETNAFMATAGQIPGGD